MFLLTRPRSFWLKTKKKKKNWGPQNQSWWRCHARNTCTLHLQTRLSGHRNFFTDIARRRKKNFLLLRSLMEVDDMVNVSNHYSKKHDARHSCTFAKALRTPQRPLARIRQKPSASESHCLVTENQKPRSFLLKSSNVASADSNEVLLWQKHQHMCLVWNVNLVRTSHLTSNLGKTNAFAMLINVSVEQIRERSLPAKRGQVPGKGKLSWGLEAVYLYHCLLKDKQKNDCTQHNTVNPKYFVRTQFSYPGLSDLSYAWNFRTVADRCRFSGMLCTFRMHFIFVPKEPCTKYTKITCIRNILDLQ